MTHTLNDIDNEFDENVRSEDELNLSILLLRDSDLWRGGTHSRNLQILIIQQILLLTRHLRYLKIFEPRDGVY